MQKAKVEFEYEIYNSIEELMPEDKVLLEQARNITSIAYAPYSKFLVGAAAMLENGAVVKGTNQENASYPVGICAERTLLGAAAMTHTNVPIITMAIAYNNLTGNSDVPVSPCGMCRQSLSEYENRTGKPIRLILSGMEGKIFIIENTGNLLPFSFSGDHLLGL
ncbi:MAG: cytidine deaminase [Bacteroidota bacterium]